MSYELLRLIWWILIGVLLIGFMVMDGHDMGVGTLVPFIGKTDAERKAAINSVAPHWDGNQVWFVTAGGAVFAAWPLVYATSFSILYIAILAVLWTIFLRAPAFEYRSKIQAESWRSLWDWVLFVGSAVPPLLFGVAFGNLMLGVPFHFDNSMHLVNDAISPLSGFLKLLSPFALICGLVALSMVTAHGGVYLTLRTEGALQRRSRNLGMIFAILTVLFFASGGLFIAHLPGYVALNLNPEGESNPLIKTVHILHGAWLNNYSAYPLLFLAPFLGCAAQGLSLLSLLKHKPGRAFVFSGISMAGIILTPAIAMFPFILPSSSSPSSSLTVWDATSSAHTLLLMLIAALIFTPLIVIYTSWVYKIMRGKLTLENSKTYY